MDTKKLICAILITFGFIFDVSLLAILFMFDLVPIVIVVFYVTGIAAMVYFML